MKDGKRVPVFYSILQGKDKETYKTMFEIINEVTNKGMTKKLYIMGDMEILHFKFLRKYGNIRMKICYFHYSQCIYRRGKSMKKCSPELLNSLKALAIVPINRVLVAITFLYIKYYRDYEGSNKEYNGEIIDYFINRYLIKNEKWNVSDFENRTNNYCESLNRDIKRYFELQKFKNFRKDEETYGRCVSAYIVYRREEDKDRKVQRKKTVEAKDKIIQQMNQNEDKLSTEYIMGEMTKVSRKMEEKSYLNALLDVSTGLTEVLTTEEKLREEEKKKQLEAQKLKEINEDAERYEFVEKVKIIKEEDEDEETEDEDSDDFDDSEDFDDFDEFEIDEEFEEVVEEKKPRNINEVKF